MSITRKPRRPLSDETREKIRISNTKHGGKGTRLYHVWKGVRYRCNSTSSPAFQNYGGRGIGLCDEWDDFSVFREWAYSHGYNDSLTIERIDVDKGYCPENCKWVTLEDQAKNRRSTVWVEYGGEKHCLSDVARESGIDYHALYWRIVTQGWPVEKAITTPSRRKNRGGRNEAVWEAV